MPARVLSTVELGPTGKLLLDIVNKYPKAHELTITSGKDGDHGAVSHHYGLSYFGSPTAAIDIVGVPGGGVTESDKKVMREFSAWLIAFSALIVELIHSPGFYVKNQRLSEPYAVADHFSHVHFATSANLATKMLTKLSPQTPIPTPPKPGPVMANYGIDVSYHQGSIDWSKVRSAGISFATMKASVGTPVQSYESLGYFKANAPKMKQYIPFVGAYHWLSPRSKAPIATQVSNFLQSMKEGLGTYEGHIVQLDAEDAAITPTDIKLWMEEWNKRTNHYPVAGYVPDWLPTLAAQLSEYGFRAWWSSEYVSGTGTYLQLATKITPVHWHSVDGVKPTILQYTSKSSVPGVNGYCDANQTKLSLNELRGLLTRTPSPPSDDDTYLEEDMPRLGDNMTLKYKDPVTGEEKAVGVTYETYLSLVYQQNQAIMANTKSTPPTVGDVVVSEES